MAADTDPITESNQEHLLTDTHRCLEILERINGWLDDYEPMLAQFRAQGVVAAYTASRRARKNGAGS